MSKGIDYGLGKTNIDLKTGIRYGVISQNAISPWAVEDMEDDYGKPHCPKCGNEAHDAEIAYAPNFDEDDYCANCEHNHGKKWGGGSKEPTRDHKCHDCPCVEPDFIEWEEGPGCRDYFCRECHYVFDSSEAFGDECLGHFIDEEDFKVTMDHDGDIFVILSHFKTRAQFCSPCAPGACHLEHPMDDGEWCYCLGHDWFEGDKAPYPVYRVDTGELVEPQ